MTGSSSGIEPDGVAGTSRWTAPLPGAEGPGRCPCGEVGHLLSDRDAGLFTTAVALANWHAAAPVLAAQRPDHDGGRRRLDAGRPRTATSWPRTDPAMIVLVHDGVAGPEGRCLLGSNAAWRWPTG